MTVLSKLYRYENCETGYSCILSREAQFVDLSKQRSVLELERFKDQGLLSFLETLQTFNRVEIVSAAVQPITSRRAWRRSRNRPIQHDVQR